MGATAIAISAGASGQAAAASAAAHRARVTACQGYVRGYAHESATVSEMQEYADCVELLNPTPMSANAITAAKVALVVILVCAAVGAWREARDDSSGGDLLSLSMGAVMGGLGGVAILLVVGAIGFVVTA